MQSHTVNNEIISVGFVPYHAVPFSLIKYVRWVLDFVTTGVRPRFYTCFVQAGNNTYSVGTITPDMYFQSTLHTVDRTLEDVTSVIVGIELLTDNGHGVLVEFLHNLTYPFRFKDFTHHADMVSLLLDENEDIRYVDRPDSLYTQLLLRKLLK